MQNSNGDGRDNFGFASSDDQREEENPPGYDDIDKMNSDGSIVVNPKFTQQDSQPGVLNFWSPRTQMAKLRIWKNVLILSFGFVLLFSAFQSISNLQSTMNSDEGLGTSSLAMVYAALIFSCLFLPPVVIGFLGFKWTLVVAPICYGSYMVANLVKNFIPCTIDVNGDEVEGRYFRWTVMMLSAALLGLSAAPMWTAKSSYMTELGIMYSKLTGETKEAVINRFFGVFFLFFQSGQIWGNLISSEILKKDKNSENGTSLNSTKRCGVEWSLSNSAPGEDCAETEIEQNKVSLCAIFIVCAAASSLVFLFLLDNFRRGDDNNNDDDNNDNNKGVFSLLLVTVKNLKDVNQILFVPLTIWSGIEQGFILSDYTKAWVSCAMGMENIGYTMIAFGLSDSVCSFVFGRLVKWLGRVFFFVLAATVNLAAIFAMYFWVPVNPDLTVVFYVLAAMWGVADAVWQTQINALYGVLFMKNQEAGFANYRLWESTGFIIAFIYADLISIQTKIFVLILVLAAGMSGYFLIEVRERFLKKSRDEQNTQTEAKESNGETTEF